MTDSLAKKEQAKYEAMWNIPSYRTTSPGYLLADSFFDFFKGQIVAGDSITDFGCGSGFTALPFLEKGLSVHLVDIAKNALADKIEALTLLSPDTVKFTLGSLWELPETLPPSDWIYCMDVLEHLPTEKVDQALAGMAKRTLKGGALQVFLEDETYGDLIGETLHLTIKPLNWWREKIGAHFTILGVATIIQDVRYTIFVAPKITN